LSGAAGIVNFLAKDVSVGTHINIMDQYRPCHLARDFAELSRPITAREYAEAVRMAIDAGLQVLEDRRAIRLWLENRRQRG
jgi:putative pyruvate formate lyase activating enzyme